MLDPRDKKKGVGGEKQNVKHRHQKVYQRLPVDLFGEIKALLTRVVPHPGGVGKGGSWRMVGEVLRIITSPNWHSIFISTYIYTFKLCLG